MPHTPLSLPTKDVIVIDGPLLVSKKHYDIAVKSYNAARHRLVAHEYAVANNNKQKYLQHIASDLADEHGIIQDTCDRDALSRYLSGGSSDSRIRRHNLIALAHLYSQCGVALNRLGEDRDEAEMNFKQAASIFYVLGLHYDRKGQHKNALQAYSCTINRTLAIMLGTFDINKNYSETLTNDAVILAVKHYGAVSEGCDTTEREERATLQAGLAMAYARRRDVMARKLGEKAMDTGISHSYDTMPLTRVVLGELGIIAEAQNVAASARSPRVTFGR